MNYEDVRKFLDLTQDEQAKIVASGSIFTGLNAQGYLEENLDNKNAFYDMRLITRGMQLMLECLCPDAFPALKELTNKWKSGEEEKPDKVDPKTLYEMLNKILKNGDGGSGQD